MKIRIPFLAPTLFGLLVLLGFGLATAAPWKNDAMGVLVNFPGTWKLITPKIAYQRMRAAKASNDSADMLFYGELKKRTQTGNFFLFEEKPKSKVRADIQAAAMGKPMRALNEADIVKLCPLWAQNRRENERPFTECGPRKLGTAWTAYFVYQADPAGNTEYQIKHFRTDGTLIQFTVAGSRAQAEAIFSHTKFY